MNTKTQLIRSMLLTALVLSKGMELKAITNMAESNVGFVRNEGQVRDQHGSLAHDVLYVAFADGIQVQLRRTGFSYQVFCGEPTAATSSVRGSLEFGGTASVERMDFDFITPATQQPRVEEAGELGGTSNYVGDVEVYGVRSFARVKYIGVWQGADVLFEIIAGEDGTQRFKYSIIAREGTSIASLGMAIRGAKKVEARGGVVQLDGERFGIEESIPESWLVTNEGRKVPVHMEYSTGSTTAPTVLFACTDRSLTQVPAGHQLVIDPTPNRVWGTYYGGTNVELDGGMDSRGGITALCGQTLSTTSIATAGAFQSTISSLYDAFVVRFDNSGNRVWGTYFGGTADDRGWGTAVDGSGNIYLSGVTRSSGMATGGAHQGTLNGIEDAFVVKFNSSGVRQWSTYYGGASNDRGWSIAVDNTGNVFLSGDTHSFTPATSVATAGSHQPSYGGNGDTFLVKFNSSGVRQWGTYYGGSQDDEGARVATDGTGNVYITATFTTSTNNIASAGAHQTSFGGANDTFLAKFNTSGVRQWGTYYGGADYDSGSDIAVDCYDRVYLVGFTRSTNNIHTAGAFQTAISGTNDGFMVRFTAAGSRMFGTYYGGTGNEGINSIAVSGADLVYVCGSTTSSSGMSTAGTWQTAYGGSGDGFVSRFSTAGARIWCTYYGGSAGDACNFMDFITSSDVVIAGGTASNNGIASAGSHQATNNGNGEAFLARLDASLIPLLCEEKSLFSDPAELCESMKDAVVYDLRSGALRINAGDCDACTISVHDMSGRRVYDAQLGSASSVALPDDLKTKPFVVRIASPAGTCSKVIVPH